MLLSQDLTAVEFKGDRVACFFTGTSFFSLWKSKTSFIFAQDKTVLENLHQSPAIAAQQKC